GSERLAGRAFVRILSRPPGNIRATSPPGAAPVPHLGPEVRRAKPMAVRGARVLSRCGRSFPGLALLLHAPPAAAAVQAADARAALLTAGGESLPIVRASVEVTLVGRLARTTTTM